jgi:hypothetical protein
MLRAGSLAPFRVRKGKKLYLRDTLRLPAKGLSPSALPIFHQPAKNTGLVWQTSEVRSWTRGSSNAAWQTGIGLGDRSEDIADCSLHRWGVKAVSPLTRVAPGANLARPPRLPRLETKCAASNAAG